VSRLQGRIGALKGHFISVFMFGAWLIAAGGWLRVFAPLWLAYPAWIVGRLAHDRRNRRSSPDDFS
jgi:hypothetical protein